MRVPSGSVHAHESPCLPPVDMMMKWRAPIRRTGQSAWATPFAQSLHTFSSNASLASRAMRISDTLCCTSGWWAIEFVSATEVRLGMRSIVMSNARRAAP